MKYTVSAHATQRTIERLGIKREHVDNYLNQLMETSTEIPHNGQGTMFQHPKTKIRLIVNKQMKQIITVYPRAEANPNNALISDPHMINLLIEAYKVTYKDERTSMYTLEIERAELIKQIFELKLRNLRAVVDKVKLETKEQIDILSDEETNLSYRITQLFNKMEKSQFEIERVTGRKVVDFIEQ